MNERKVEAPIHCVTVFRNGALVARRGTSSAGRIHLGDLPLLFNSDSLRVNARHGSVRDVEEACSLESEPAEPPPTEAERRRIALEARRLDDETASVESLVKLYQEVGPGKAGKMETQDMPDAATWIALHQFAGKRLGALAERRRQLEYDKRELAKRHKKLEKADRGDREPPRFTRGVTFTLTADEGDSAAELVFEVEYFVPAARWVPTYTLHLNTAPGSDSERQSARARLTLSALVAQATGEDWQGAAIRFSTADLARETTLPELRSWRIGRAQPQWRPAFRPLPTDLETLFAGYDTAAKKPARPAPAAHRPMPAPAAAEPAVAEIAFEEAVPAELRDANLDDTLISFVDEAIPEMEAAAAAAPMPSATPASAAPAASARRGSAQDRGRAPRAAQEAVLGFAGGAAPASMKRLRAPVLAAAVVPRPAPPQALPPRLRYAYLRLAGPDQPMRGTLSPIDPLEHLWSLVEDHRTADVRDLRRAVDALRRAAAKLSRSPTPPGTTPLADTSFHHVYEASGTHDVPSDGGYHRLLVERSETDVSTLYRAVPGVSDDVYRFCRLAASSGGTPYPTGPLHVYEDDDFRVTSRLEGTGGGKALELNLGVEPALRMTGRTVDVKQQEKGVMVAQKSKVEHRVRVRLRSALDHEARIEVYDRLPTPADDEKDIEVRLTQSTPEAAPDGLDPAGKKLDGALHWELDLAPGARGEVSYAYEISLPSGSELVGGNRRE